MDARCEPDAISLQGNATDETCLVLLDAESNGAVQVGGANVSVFTLPTSGQAFSSSALTINFRWTSPIDADGDVDALAAAPALVPHEPPVTGAVHMIRLKGAGDDLLFFTTQLNVVVTGPPVTALQSAAGPLSAEVTSVYLTENRILTPSSDGPFRRAADTAFTFAP